MKLLGWVWVFVLFSVALLLCCDCFKQNSAAKSGPPWHNYQHSPVGSRVCDDFCIRIHASRLSLVFLSPEWLIWLMLRCAPSKQPILGPLRVPHWCTGDAWMFASKKLMSPAGSRKSETKFSIDLWISCITVSQSWCWSTANLNMLVFSVL